MGTALGLQCILYTYVGPLSNGSALAGLKQKALLQGQAPGSPLDVVSDKNYAEVSPKIGVPSWGL